uniref:Uncharacterized protein n=1 Tax=Tanacetum cinerariifolium TaxID=118510 RepID=A0A6L2N1R7_TANCI|nr:hypothetical protein [Tanacetum cinerariifolium]
MARCLELIFVANLTLLNDMMRVHFDKERAKCMHMVIEMSGVCQELTDKVMLYNSTIDLIEGMKQKDIQIKEFDALSGSVVAFKSVEFLKKLLKEDLLKVMELEKRNAQLKLNDFTIYDPGLVYGKILSDLQRNISKKRDFLIVFDWGMYWAREIKVYVETNMSLVEQHIGEVRSGKGKGVVLEKIMKDVGLDEQHIKEVRIGK